MAGMHTICLLNHIVLWLWPKEQNKPKDSPINSNALKKKREKYTDVCTQLLPGFEPGEGNVFEALSMTINITNTPQSGD